MRLHLKAIKCYSCLIFYYYVWHKHICDTQWSKSLHSVLHNNTLNMFTILKLLFIRCKKTSLLGVFLLRIFPHSDWIQRDTSHLSVLSQNAGKYGPEKLRIPTLFMQCKSVVLPLASSGYSYGLHSHLEPPLLITPSFVRVQSIAYYVVAITIMLLLPEPCRWKKKNCCEALGFDIWGIRQYRNYNFLKIFNYFFTTYCIVRLQTIFYWI